MKLRLIPAGEFLMGFRESDKEARDWEKPQHQVKITKAFYLGKYEVTQREWKLVMGTTPWHDNPSVKEGKDHAPREGDDYPATFVSWDEATEFCKKLSQNEAQPYRLPTDAEWEYACRARSLTRYHFGDDKKALNEYAWYGENINGEAFAHRVGQKKKTPFGLYDMHGNAWEWCNDWLDASYYANSPVDDPQGPESGRTRVIRGGSWGNLPVHCESAIKDGFTPSTRFSATGFRIALELSQ